MNRESRVDPSNQQNIPIIPIRPEVRRMHLFNGQHRVNNTGINVAKQERERVLRQSKHEKGLSQSAEYRECAHMSPNTNFQNEGGLENPDSIVDFGTTETGATQTTRQNKVRQYLGEYD